MSGTISVQTGETPCLAAGQWNPTKLTIFGQEETLPR